MDERIYVALGLPADVARKLQTEAQRLSLSRSALVTAALSAYLPGLRRAQEAATAAAGKTARRRDPG
jgi:predicted transcriptional regulator